MSLREREPTPRFIERPDSIGDGGGFAEFHERVLDRRIHATQLRICLINASLVDVVGHAGMVPARHGWRTRTP